MASPPACLCALSSPYKYTVILLRVHPKSRILNFLLRYSWHFQRFILNEVTVTSTRSWDVDLFFGGYQSPTGYKKVLKIYVEPGASGSRL
jgi:hypothetical protein